MGHDFVLLKQGKLYDAMPFTRSNFMQDSFIWRKYHFNKEAFRLAAKISTACDLFVMDEIGPLELEDGMGFSNTLDRVIKSGVNSLIVARTKVKPLIQKLLPNQNVAYGHF
jgi:nucleoside-triphosphatase THEP1